MTFDQILRDYAAGQIRRNEMRLLLIAYPALRQWIMNQLRAGRARREDGTIDTILANAASIVTGQATSVEA